MNILILQRFKFHLGSLKASIKGLCAALSVGLLTISLPVFAEAPVYDADAMPQQLESDAGDQADAAPPTSDQDETFVPMRSQPASPVARNNTEVISPTPESMTTDERIKRLELQINNMQNNEEIARTESLQTQVQALHEQVDQLTHQMQQLQEQQKGLYADIEKKLAQQPTAKAAPPIATADAATADKAKPAPKATTGINLFGKSNAAPADTAKPENQPNVAEEQQIYQTAYTLIKGKKYNEAVTVLQNMLQKYPSGQFASNAHYWLGELYGLLGKNDQALNEFSTVIKTYPDSPRISDAQLKVGLIYAAQFKWPEAKLAFKRVINHYPGTTSSRLAQEQLKQIKQAGH